MRWKYWNDHSTLWSSIWWSSLPQCEMKYILMKTYLHITQNSKIMFRIMDDGILPVLFNNFVTTSLLKKDIKVSHAGQVLCTAWVDFAYHVIILVILTLDLILTC